MSFWDAVIEKEKAYFAGLKAKLKEFGELASSSNREDLKKIYSGAREAYAKGSEALKSFEQSMQQLRNSVKVAAFPAKDGSLTRIEGMSAARTRATLFSLATARCLGQMPSDVYREEMRAQGKAFLAEVQAMIQDTSIDDATLLDYMKKLGGMVCELVNEDAPIQAQEKEQESLLGKALKMGLPAVAGWFGRGVYDQYQRGA